MVDDLGALAGAGRAAGPADLSRASASSQSSIPSAGVVFFGAIAVVLFGIIVILVGFLLAVPVAIAGFAGAAAMLGAVKLFTSAMSAGTAETRSGSGRQPASAVGDSRDAQPGAPA